MTKNSVALLTKYWFEELGCRPEDLPPGRVHVAAHGTLKGYRGIMAFKRNQSCVVSCPAELVQTIHSSLSQTRADEAFRAHFFERLLGNKVDRIIGPAWVGQLAETEFRPSHGPETREITQGDVPVVEAFLASCPPEDVEVSSIEPERFPMFGAFANGTLGAVSSYEILEGYIAHIGILTHPNFRGQGLGRKAISNAAEAALKAGLGIQYRTLLSNVSSVAAAKRLGFRDFAETIAIRLK